MREKIFIALWERVKQTYPPGSNSKLQNALLESDFESFIDEVMNIIYEANQCK